jgi:hypothetical protein
VLERLPADSAFVEKPQIKCDDPFGFRWTFQAPDFAFISPNALAGRWLDV